MFTMKAFLHVMTLLFSLFMSAVMSIVMALVNSGGVPFPAILLTILEGFVVAVIASYIVPITKLGDILATKLGAKHDTVKYLLISTIPVALYFSLVMTFAFTALAIGFPPFFWQAFLEGLPIAIAVGYVVGVLASPPAVKLAKWICSKPME